MNFIDKFSTCKFTDASTNYKTARLSRLYFNFSKVVSQKRLITITQINTYTYNYVKTCLFRNS